jgi:ribosomal protein L37AE/L43A
MTIIIGFILGFIAFVLLLLFWIAAVSHHCDGCGETLVRSAGSRWHCPKCGRIYIISVLGLGRMRQVAFGSQDDENMVKEE